MKCHPGPEISHWLDKNNPLEREQQLCILYKLEIFPNINREESPGPRSNISSETLDLYWWVVPAPAAPVSGSCLLSSLITAGNTLSPSSSHFTLYTLQHIIFNLTAFICIADEALFCVILQANANYATNQLKGLHVLASCCGASVCCCIFWARVWKYKVLRAKHGLETGETWIYFWWHRSQPQKKKIEI